jgi:hypothetical protein
LLLTYSIYFAYAIFVTDYKKILKIAGGVKQLTVPLLPDPNCSMPENDAKSSPAPRDNSFDCSLNRHEITVLLSYIHEHNHKSTEDDNVSIPYHSKIRHEITVY